MYSELMTASRYGSPTRVADLGFFPDSFQSEGKSTLAEVDKSLPVSFVNIDSIDVSPAEFKALVECLLASERDKVLRYRMDKDQMRSLVSILLQRKIIREKLDCRDCDYQIMRTRETKPYPVSATRVIANWNYNVSHHGSFVGIVSDAEHIVGVDVVELRVRSTWKKDAVSYIDMFRTQFTPLELRLAKNNSSDNDRYRYFFVNWSLKEAYIKAVGTGLEMNLQSLHFAISFDSCPPPPPSECDSGHMPCRGSAQLFINSRPAKDWSFVFQELDSFHVITVAKGPLKDVAQSYRLAASMQLSDSKITMESVKSVTDVPPFALKMNIRQLSLEDLMPYDMLRLWEHKMTHWSDDESGF